MIKLKVEYGPTGTGLGYQISSYFLLKSLAKQHGYQCAVGKYELLNLRNTFESIEFDDIDSKPDDEYSNQFFVTEGVKFEDFADLKDDTLLIGYPSSDSFYHPEYFEQIKKSLVFRKEIKDKCSNFMSQFSGQEVISMHIRAGDYTKIENGMFVCGDDYFLNALEYFPEDAKVLIFTNDKEYVRSNPNYQSDRFILVTDIFNNNELINCDWGQLIDKRIDISGKSRFYYKYIIAKLAEETNVPVADIAKELHPDYVYKIKNNLYNLSFDLCLMSMCDYHIASNSSYGMWGIALSNTKSVVYPKYWLQGHPEGDKSDMVILKDLDGFNQTKEMIGYIKDTWIPLENPDARVQ